MGSTTRSIRRPLAGNELTPGAKLRGVKVETPHGRALTFGVPKDRTEQMLETLAARKYREVAASMQELKAARLKSKSGS